MPSVRTNDLGEEQGPDILGALTEFETRTLEHDLHRPADEDREATRRPSLTEYSRDLPGATRSRRIPSTPGSPLGVSSSYLDEPGSAQFNLDIAIGTISDLQGQLVHANRTIEQLAADNVGLSREAKKSKHVIAKLEAKLLKTKQPDITPGASRTLQEAVEKNTRVLTDFLEQMNRRDMVMQHPSQYPPPQQPLPPGLTQRLETLHQEQAAEVADLQAVVADLMQLKLSYESVSRQALIESQGKAGPRRDSRQAEQRADEANRFLAQGDRPPEGDGRLRQLEAEIRLLRDRHLLERQKIQDRHQHLQAEYSSLQRHVVAISSQNTSLQKDLGLSKKTLAYVRRQLQEARSSKAAPKAFLSAQTALLSQQEELERVRGALKEREAMLSTQLAIRRQYKDVIRNKTEQVMDLTGRLGATTRRFNTRMMQETQLAAMNRQKAVQLRARHPADITQAVLSGLTTRNTAPFERKTVAFSRSQRPATAPPFAVRKPDTGTNDVFI